MVVVVRFGTYNIQNRFNGGCEAVLRRMSQVNVDLGLLQETKITDRVYTRDSAGFLVILADSLSRHRGGMALFYKYLPRFAVETHKQHGPDVIIFQLVMGR